MHRRGWRGDKVGEQLSGLRNVRTGNTIFRRKLYLFSPPTEVFFQHQRPPQATATTIMSRCADRNIVFQVRRLMNVA
jgi:hypothetical protein